jgi:hypothetical protein
VQGIDELNEEWLRARPFELASGAILRYSLVLFLVLFGLAEFTEAEALTIQPWVANSPFLGWLYAVTSVQGGSNLIGVIELTLASCSRFGRGGRVYRSSATWARLSRS